MKEALKAPVKVGQKMKFDMEEDAPNIGDTNTNGNKDGSSFASPKKVSSMNNNKSNNSNAVTPNGDDRGLTTPRFKNMTPRDIFSSLRTRRFKVSLNERERVCTIIKYICECVHSA